MCQSAFGDRLKQNDMRHAIKTGMALAMLAAPAFFDATRPIFVEYKGEWALISVCGLVSMAGKVLNSCSVLCGHIAHDWSSKPSINSTVRYSLSYLPDEFPGATSRAWYIVRL